MVEGKLDSKGRASMQTHQIEVKQDLSREGAKVLAETMAVVHNVKRPATITVVSPYAEYILLIE